MTKQLSKELSNHISNCLGLSPLSFGKVGLTQDDLKQDLILKFELSDERVMGNVWLGVSEDSNMFTVSCIAIQESLGFFESYTMFGFFNSENKIDHLLPIFGFRYNYLDEEDCGDFYSKVGDEWVAMSLVQKLKLTLGVESMVQEGKVYIHSNIQKTTDVFSCFRSFYSLF